MLYSIQGLHLIGSQKITVKHVEKLVLKSISTAILVTLVLGLFTEMFLSILV